MHIYFLLHQIQAALFDFEFSIRPYLPIHLHFIPEPTACVFKNTLYLCSILEFRENFRNLALLTTNKVGMIVSILQRPEKSMQFSQGPMKQQMAELILLYNSIAPDVCLSQILLFVFYSTFQNITCFSMQISINILA